MAAGYRFWLKICALTAMLLGLPLSGVYLAGRPLAPYLQFPPMTRRADHMPFSWPVFVILALVIAAVIGALGVSAVRGRSGSLPASPGLKDRPMPWWGWAGATFLATAWTLAWTRFEWMRPLQAHTFTPLWVGYILVVNALCRKRSGGCLMTDRPKFFLLLFPLSAVFWWIFEFLNRFVQNWYYTGPDLSPWAYFWYATLPFSTVLPAVLSTGEWLQRTGWIRRGFGGMPPLALLNSRKLAVAVMAAAAAGLGGVGIWPDALFPVLWLSPLLLIISLTTLTGEHSLIGEMAAGNWVRAVAVAGAALICGLLWEMWNFYSLAKWKYSIPLVHRFALFEMPALGYAGYLTFGMECCVIGDLLQNALKHRR